MTQSVASFASLPPAPPSVCAAAEDPVEGVSTPEQLLERWGGFVGASSRLLARERAHFSARHRLPATRPPAAHPGGGCPLGERPLAAGACASARALAALAASLRAARACAAAAPPLCQALARFGEAARAEPAEATSQVPAALIAEFAELLPALADARRLLDRVAEVAEHLVRQLVGFQGASSSGRELGQLPVRPVLDALGDVLAVAATMDGVVLENQELRNAHLNFSWIVSKASGGLLELPPEAAVQLGVELREAEPLMRGDAFRACTARAAEGLAGLAAEPSGLKLREEALAYFATRLKESEELASSGPSSGAQRCLLLALPSEALVPWVCAWVLFASAWEPSRSDARLMADVFRAHKRSPFLVLFGRVVWCVGEFLQAHLPGLVDSGLRRDLEEMRGAGRRQATRMDDGLFAQEVRAHAPKVQAWLAGLRVAGGAGSVGQVLKDEHRTLLRGLVYARRLRSVLEEYLVLHVCQGVPVPRRCVEPVGLALRLLKAIEAGPAAPRWSDLSVLLQHRTAVRVRAEVEDARKKAGRRAPQSLRQALDAVSAALHEVVASPTPELAAPHLDAGSLALCCAGLGEAGGSALGSAWRELGMASRWRDHVARLCDTSFCYWVRELLPELLKGLWRHPRGPGGLPLLCRAWAAPLEGGLLPPGSPCADRYAGELREALEGEVAAPLVALVEQDQRLHAHAVMQAAPDALPHAAPSQSRALLALPPLPLGPGLLVDLKELVESRLSANFYNLTAIAPQDAEAYERMRALALERYGLSVLDGRLPAGTLDHGLDVIDVMRGVHVFAAQYNYSLHQQFFVQASNRGDAKIRTITTEHLADSIQIHGAGVVLTAVNCTYGFLRRKLEVVTEFLSDEGVRSRMLADRQWLESRRSGGGYTWERAVETSRFLRRLGTASDGVPFLDKLRQVVTQIGNALGYVRMVRSASMHSVARGLPYTQRAPRPGQPQGEPGDGFLGSASAAGCPDLVLEAASAADEALGAVRRCFSAGSDYLNLMAQTFASALAASGEAAASEGRELPTRLFHLLLPAMTLSFLDALLVGRDALRTRAAAKQGLVGQRGDAYFFDDGFAVGAALVLRVFGLDQEFQALRWFRAAVAAEADVPPPGAAQDAVFAQARPGRSQKEALEREMASLAATIEAASSLFGPGATEAAPGSPWAGGARGAARGPGAEVAAEEGAGGA